jgi:DNA primase
MNRKVDVERLLRKLKIDFERDGVECVALCPNPTHVDGKPSWSIVDNDATDAHGLHNCFSCGFGGTPIDLVMAHFGFAERRSAFDWLERKKMFDDSPEPLTLSVKVTKTKDVEESTGEYHYPSGVIDPPKPIGEWPKPIRDYILNTRQVTPRQIDKWRITYATRGKFEGRVVIPIRDFDMILRSCFARNFLKNGRAKYLNPVGKGALGPIFGEAFWPPPQFRKGSSVVVCEGALNALACERAGIRNVAALGGSNVDKEHIRKLATFGEVVILTDADASGNKAARKFAPLGRWTKLRRVKLPKGLDANDLDVSELAKALTNAPVPL